MASSEDASHSNDGVRPASPLPGTGASDAELAKLEKTEHHLEPVPRPPETQKDSSSASGADSVEEFKEGGYGW